MLGNRGRDWDMEQQYRLQMFMVQAVDAWPAVTCTLYYAIQVTGLASTAVCWTAS